MKKIIFALALLICASSVTIVASDLSDARRSLKSAQKELSSASSKLDKAQQKQNRLQADYENALTKIEANQDKPKSIAYKDAVKKSESLSKKLEQNSQLLATLNRQVDSLQNIVSECESVLSQVHQEEVEEVKAEDVATIESATESVAERHAEREEKSDAIDFSKYSKSTEETTSNNDVSSSQEPTTFWGKVWKVIKTTFLIIIGIIVFAFFIRIGGKGGSSSSRSSSRSSYSSSGSTAQSDKKRRIADKQVEIARQQEKIERLKDSIASRKRNKLPYRDLEASISTCRQRIASLKGDIARIKAS